MARLTAPPSFTGTVGPVTVYYMFGQYYIRARSSLTGKRVKKDPAFRKTMQYAALLGHAARIASAVYAGLPVQHKQHALYRKLTGEAMTWLKYQWEAADIIEYLTRQYGGVHLPAEAPVTRLRPVYSRSNPGQCLSAPRLRYSTTGLVKTTPGKTISLGLRQWRRMDKAFRKYYRQELPDARCSPTGPVLPKEGIDYF